MGSRDLKQANITVRCKITTSTKAPTQNRLNAALATSVMFRLERKNVSNVLDINKYTVSKRSVKNVRRLFTRRALTVFATFVESDAQFAKRTSR